VVELVFFVRGWYQPGFIFVVIVSIINVIIVIIVIKVTENSCCV
jgi:hypothetical protein